MNTATLTHGRGWLTTSAAASVHRIDAALGRPLDINEAGRTWAQQNAHYQRYLRYLAGGPWAPIALPPGSSIHEFGRAIDTDDHVHHDALLVEHGWIRTVYRGGRLVERWHYEYRINNDQHHEGDTMAGITTDWIGDRLGGSNKSGPDITDMLREIDSKLDALALDQTWIKEQVGGSNARDTSLRQDVDKIIRRLDG